jgi:hypothetical protein
VIVGTKLWLEKRCEAPGEAAGEAAELPFPMHVHMLRDRNDAPALPIRSISSNSSLVDRPSRSSLVTTTMSPGISFAISLASCGRSARTPLTFSR